VVSNRDAKSKRSADRDPGILIILACTCLGICLCKKNNGQFFNSETIRASELSGHALITVGLTNYTQPDWILQFSLSAEREATANADLHAADHLGASGPVFQRQG